MWCLLLFVGFRHESFVASETVMCSGEGCLVWNVLLLSGCVRFDVGGARCWLVTSLLHWYLCIPEVYGLRYTCPGLLTQQPKISSCLQL